MTETLSIPTTYAEVLERHPDMHRDLRAHTERLALSNGETIPRDEVEELGEIADEGAGVTVAEQNRYGEQLSIEDEFTERGQWPATIVQESRLYSEAPKENGLDLTAMSPQEENGYIHRTIKHTQAQNEYEAGVIDLGEYTKRVEDIHKTPREYQQPLLRQDGQLFEAAEPLVNDPHVGVSAENGTFWHASNQHMEPGDRLMPAGEVPDSIHESNKTSRTITSSSSPKGSSFDQEKDFAMGTPRDAGYLPPSSYGKYVYKVSAPNAKIVQTVNGPEVWAEGGGRIEQRMHPDFAQNYQYARNRVVSGEGHEQPSLEGMENGMAFVPEDELNVPGKDFYDKYQKEIDDAKYASEPNPLRPSPEDVALPGLSDYGKRPPVQATPPGQRPEF